MVLNWRRACDFFYRRNWKPLEKSLVWEKETFLTFHRRAKYPSKGAKPARAFPIHSQLAVVVQGPIVTKNDFTVETLRWLKKTWPSSKIILSTWDEALLEDVGKKVPHGVHVVCQSKPNYVGPYNVNLQLRSTQLGISKAREIGANFILKMRSDQRIGHPGAIHQLEFLRKTGSKKHESRLVVLSANSFVNRNFGLSDFFSYGTSVDQSLLWGMDEVKENDCWPMNETPEARIWSSFAAQLGYKIEESSEYFSFLRHKVSIVDASSLDWSWSKYTRREYPYRKKRFQLIEMSQASWLEILAEDP